VPVRSRTDADIAACSELAHDVHVHDGYPPYVPGGDLRVFLVTPQPLHAWVAEEETHVVGHVVLHPHSSAEVMAVAGGALGVAPARLGVVARLLVHPAARGRGRGRTLLATAAAEATARGLWPILDVATRFTGAVGLYESCGWVRAGRVRTRLPDGTDLDEFVYVAPAPPPAAPDLDM